MLLPSIIRQTQYIEAPMLKRWIFLYWISAMLAVLVLMTILSFNELNVMMDDHRKKTDDIAKIAISAGVIIIIFCGILSQYNVMNPIGVVFVTILTLFILPVMCFYGVMISWEGKERNDLTAMYYIQQLKRTWDTEGVIPTWLTTTQRHKRCCGIKSYKDYRIYIYGNNASLPDFPQSCCTIRKWEWFYKDPPPRTISCNKNIFTSDPSAIDPRPPHQKEMEKDMYGSLTIPIESSHVNFNQLYFQGCEHVTLDSTRNSYGATLVLLLCLGFWSLIIFMIHMVRFNKYMELSVQPVQNDTSTDNSSFSPSRVGEKSGDSEADSFQNTVNQRIQLEEDPNSALVPKSKVEMDFIRTFPVHSKDSLKYDSDSESYDETDTEEMKNRRGTDGPRDRFEFIVALKPDKTTNESSHQDLEKRKSVRYTGVKVIEAGGSKRHVAKNEGDEQSLRDKVKDYRRHQLTIFKKEKAQYDNIISSDIGHPLGPQRRYNGPSYSDKPKSSKRRATKRYGTGKSSRKPSHYPKQ